ncbi:AAA domain-containing protein [Clostridium sp. DSM 100503]|uniref:AAA domain-containing protein n=1 Tax=Clostridium sp. DSM 100503 TaxID=2963282 RepID=UPI002149B0ED|nr:AAA domain-containing protein [Clostridium sp. DSM 100503]MCR1950934.1 AAA domain-containing protein [Clostridium sp. DSM 100503]
MIKEREFEVIRRLDSKKNDIKSSSVNLIKYRGNTEMIVVKSISRIDKKIYNDIYMRELNALYGLNKCDKIVKILEHKTYKNNENGERAGAIFLEYIEGKNLSEINLEELSIRDKFSIISEIIEAISFSHSRGIIHRDINPNHIMIYDENKVKLLDFGLCKIKELLSKEEFKIENRSIYSAPEVKLHLENATEQSDLYSLGCIIYYLFTGEKPVKASIFSDIIDKTSGIDNTLKPIIKKLTFENIDSRYKTIYEVEDDIRNLLNKFLKRYRQINIEISNENIKYLKRNNLLNKNINNREIKFKIEQNFVDIYGFRNGEEYEFLGNNYIFICIFDELLNIFKVKTIKKIMPIEREKKKKIYKLLNANIKIVDGRIAHHESRNNSLEIRNQIDDFYFYYISNKNIDKEYKKKYGIWKDLLELTRKNIKNKYIRYEYEDVILENGIYTFILKAGVIPLEKFNEEQYFIYEKIDNRKSNVNKIRQRNLGYYETDYMENNRVVLKIRATESWIIPKKGKICLDYRKELANVERQLDAIANIERERYSCHFNLKGVISGVEKTKSREFSKNIKYVNKFLDFSQRTAVNKALNTSDIMMIQGPPGTGKSNVIVEIILQILKKNKLNSNLPKKKILLVSQSHKAVDKVLKDFVLDESIRKFVERLGLKYEIIRLGKNTDDFDPLIKDKFGLKELRENLYKDIIKTCNEKFIELSLMLNISANEINEYFNELEKNKIYGVKKNEINNNLIYKIGNLNLNDNQKKAMNILRIQKKWIDNLKNSRLLEMYLIKNASIISGTCVGFLSKDIKEMDFDYLIIDEVAKSTFPELAVSLTKGEKIIMVGDHKQLPAVLDKDFIEKSQFNYENFKISLFEELHEMVEKGNKEILTCQYRMHSTIGNLISKLFYNNDIINGCNDFERVIDIEEYKDISIEWIDTSKYSIDERKEKEIIYNTKTYFNKLEADLIKDKLRWFDSKSNRKIEIGVITSYRGQKYELQNIIKQQKYKNIDVEIDTVDAFQGSQKEIIIYSTVKSNKKRKKSIGFLDEEARINVAFSRAKSLLMIVGDKEFLNDEKIPKNKFPEIVKYIETNSRCRIV